MSEQNALEYLQAEGFKGNIRLKEVARFDESRLGGGEGVVYTFDDPQTDEAHYVITGVLTNYYPEWGLNPDEIYEQHLGASADPGPVSAAQREKYADRIAALLAEHGLSPEGCQVLEVWKLPSPRQPWKSVLGALVRVPARGSLTLLVRHDEPMTCTQKLWKDQPLPTYVHVRRYLGRRRRNAPPVAPPAPEPVAEMPEADDRIEPVAIAVYGVVLGAIVGYSTKRHLTPWEVGLLAGIVSAVALLGELWDRRKSGWAWGRAIFSGVLWMIFLLPATWLGVQLLALPGMRWAVGWKGALFGAVLGGIAGGVGGAIGARVQRRWRDDTDA